jgi:hypothetical protein
MRYKSQVDASPLRSTGSSTQISTSNSHPITLLISLIHTALNISVQDADHPSPLHPPRLHIPYLYVCRRLLPSKLLLRWQVHSRCSRPEPTRRRRVLQPPMERNVNDTLHHSSSHFYTVDSRPGFRLSRLVQSTCTN